jgi:hypothetical protein
MAIKARFRQAGKFSSGYQFPSPQNKVKHG